MKPYLLISFVSIRIIKTEWRDVPLTHSEILVEAIKKRIWFQQALNKTSWSTSPLSSQRQLKHPYKTKINKIMLSASPSLVFHTLLTISEWYQTRGHQCRSALLRLQNLDVYLGTWNYNHYWESADWEHPWLGTHSSANNWRSLRILYPTHKVLEWSWRRFTSLKLCKCSQISQPSPRVASASNRTKTHLHWLNHLQKLHTH